jgi:hypothetical protein
MYLSSFNSALLFLLGIVSQLVSSSPTIEQRQGGFIGVPLRGPNPPCLTLRVVNDPSMGYNTTLNSECLSSKKKVVASSLNLNACISNTNGKLEFNKK